MVPYVSREREREREKSYVFFVAREMRPRGRDAVWI
jgi:hypothetical protein